MIAIPAVESFHGQALVHKYPEEQSCHLSSTKKKDIS